MPHCTRELFDEIVKHIEITRQTHVELIEFFYRKSWPVVGKTKHKVEELRASHEQSIHRLMELAGLLSTDLETPAVAETAVESVKVETPTAVETVTETLAIAPVDPVAVTEATLAPTAPLAGTVAPPVEPETGRPRDPTSGEFLPVDTERLDSGTPGATTEAERAAKVAQDIAAAKAAIPVETGSADDPFGVFGEEVTPVFTGPKGGARILDTDRIEFNSSLWKGDITNDTSHWAMSGELSFDGDKVGNQGLVDELLKVPAELGGKSPASAKALKARAKAEVESSVEAMSVRGGVRTAKGSYIVLAGPTRRRLVNAEGYKLLQVLLGKRQHEWWATEGNRFVVAIDSKSSKRYPLAMMVSYDADEVDSSWSAINPLLDD